MNDILHARHIGKSFNGLQVLKDVSFALKPGTITSLFGENGSGKTTLFNILTGYLKADEGKVLYKGKDLNGSKPVQISRLGVGRVWQSPRICKNLTVMDNLLLATPNHPGEKLLNYIIRPKQILHEEKARRVTAKLIVSDVGLAGKLQKTAGELSFGQQKLLSIGMLLMNDSELLLLDEPFAGVNSQMLDHISDVLQSLSENGKTIFLIEHNRSKAEEISDCMFTLEKGIIIRNEVPAV
ncbi:MAG: ATP-binding cassette domain-containing protein [Candidatus Paceibacterota bacterium]